MKPRTIPAGTYLNLSGLVLGAMAIGNIIEGVCVCVASAQLARLGPNGATA